MSGQVMESAKSIVIKQLKKPDLADSPAAKKLLGKLDKSSGFPRLDISEMPESGVAQLLTSQNDQVGSPESGVAQLLTSQNDQVGSSVGIIV